MCVVGDATGRQLDLVTTQHITVVVVEFDPGVEEASRIDTAACGEAVIRFRITGQLPAQQHGAIAGSTHV